MLNPSARSAKGASSPFQTPREEEDYTFLKTRIQNSFCCKKYEACSFEVVSPVKIAIDNQKPLIEASILREKIVARLCENLIHRGFDTHIQQENIPYLGELISGSKITVSLPDVVKEESGYASDGWKPSFKASAVKKSIHKAILEVCKKTDEMIQDTLTKHSSDLHHTFEIDDSCPPGYKKAVATQLAKELAAKGINALAKGSAIIITKAAS